MAALLVIYSSSDTANNLQQVTQVIESYRSHWKVHKTAWIVRTGDTERQLAEKLPVLERSERIMVSQIPRTSAWIGYAKAQIDWLASAI